MGLEGWSDNELLGVSFALGLTVMLVVVGVYYKLAARSPLRTLTWLLFGRTKLTAEEQVTELGSEIHALIDKQLILSAHVDNYYNTVQGAGLAELLSLVEDLKMAHDLLQVMMAEGQYAEVCDLCDYLTDRLTPEEMSELASHYDGLTSLANWRARSRHLLMNLVNVTTLAAQQTRSIGVVRDGKTRRSTLISMQKVRDYLGEM